MSVPLRSFGLVLMLCFCGLAAGPAAAAAPRDSLDAMAWARAVVRLRAAVSDAEASPPAARAEAAERALRQARALAERPDGHADPALRALALRAQVLYEAHHGPVDAGALAPAEFAVLRGPALAAGPFAVPVAERETAAARAAVEAERRDVLAHLFVPLDAQPLVDAQEAVARRHFLNLRSRIRRHFPTIERTLARHRLPEDLKYVAVIESALNPLAVSHAGAEGLWQFMPETQSDYGLDSLTVRDPARATTAAALYLKRLGRMFDGDWQLALAAYNCGPGRVQRIVRAFEAETGEEATFWSIRERLPRETQDYVPRWIAVADLLGG